MTHGLFAAGFAARVREDHAAARALLAEGLDLSRTVGHRFVTAGALHHLGMIASDEREDYQAARRLLEESLTTYRALGMQRFVGVVLMTLGDVARVEGDFAGAHDLLREGLTTLVGVGERLAIPGALDSFAHLAIAEGDAARAARLAGAAARLRDLSGTQLWPAQARSRERWLAATRSALDDAGLREAWARRQATTREQAVVDALGDAAAARMTPA